MHKSIVIHALVNIERKLQKIYNDSIRLEQTTEQIIQTLEKEIPEVKWKEVFQDA